MASHAPNVPRTFRKGERLFSSGAASDRVYLLQSGLVSLVTQRGGQEIEVGHATAPQLIGEEALFGNAPRSLSAIAVNETKALELSAQEALAIMDGLPGALKIIAKCVAKKQKSVSADLLASKLENHPLEACSEEQIAQLFAVIYHAATSTGKIKNDRLTVVWPAFRKYCHWGLLESPVRLEQAIQILAKLGYAELELVKCETDPEAPDELGFVHFKDVELLHGFYLSCHEKGVAALNQAKDPTSLKHQAILKQIEIWNTSRAAETK